MNLSQKYKIDENNISYRIIGDEALILNLENGSTYSLNKSGARILEAIDKEQQLEGILKILKEVYDLPEERLKNDLVKLVKDLEEEKLITPLK